MKLYRKAAEQGYPSARVNLGNMYLNGHGVAEDYAEATKWYRMAAEQGDRVGQNNLGYMYENGFGFPLDLTEARKRYRLSANQGYALAQRNLDRMDGFRFNIYWSALYLPLSIVGALVLAVLFGFLVKRRGSKKPHFDTKRGEASASPF